MFARLTDPKIRLVLMVALAIAAVLGHHGGDGSLHTH